MKQVAIFLLVQAFPPADSFFPLCASNHAPHNHRQRQRPAITLRFASVTKSAVDHCLDTSRVETDLPIFDILQNIRVSLVDRPNLLLEAPPGAGKTSVVPLALLTESSRWVTEKDEKQLSNVFVVEPRRVAARSAALRMANILNENAGETVGYAVRGDARLSKDTKLTVVTDGVLLNRLRDDPELSGIDAIVFDEFHERGVGSDTALALSVEVQKQLRPELRLIVMSATLFDDSDGENKLLRTLGGEDGCNVLRSDGRMYPVQTQWAKRGYPPLGVLQKSRKDLVETMCNALEGAILAAPVGGDVLAFLPGAREIRQVVQELLSRRVDAEVLPLYGSLPKKQQDYVIFPPHDAGRRIIVSSPIAEASLTLERVTCVVDSGLRREPRCDIDTGMPRLITTLCSKASAKQRAGRSGRVREGLCIRLYSEAEFQNSFLEHAPPEILNTDLVPTVLLLSEWGCSHPAEICEMPFVDTPEPDALKRAYSTLVDLEALEQSGDHRYVLTPLGQSVAAIPTHPRLGTSIAKAETPEELAAAVITATFLDNDGSVRGDGEADLSRRVRTVLEDNAAAYRTRDVLQYARRISDEAVQAVQFFMNNPSEIGRVAAAIGESLLPGFIDLVAERRGDASYGGSTYMLSLGRTARLDDVRDGSEYAVVVETSTSDDSIMRIRSFAPISSEALHRVAQEKDVVFTVPSRSHEVRSRRSLMVGALELRSTPLPSPSGAEVSRILLETIRSLGGVDRALLQNMPQDLRASVEDLRQRVRLAMTLDSHSDWPSCFLALDRLCNGTATEEDVSEIEALMEPWLSSARSLKVDFLEILRGSFSNDQLVRLNRDFPLKIDAPDGTRIPISYRGETPTASAKLQQFFGTVESPTVGPQNNRLPISLSLLSPAGKLLSETIDLPFFWKEVYPSVRSEMRGRYAKHPWPEDPMSAIPTRQTKKQQASSKSTGEDKRKTKSKNRKKKR